MPVNYSHSKIKRTYRNPIIYAQELADEMKKEGLSQAELARKHGLSRARVHQWLSLLKLPKMKIILMQAMGDKWERKLLTERSLRKLFAKFVATKHDTNSGIT